MSNRHIAIVGSGQLARMMALDGIPMGLSFSFLAEENEDTRCVIGLGEIVLRQDYMIAEALYHALGDPDVVTVEKEHVDIDLLMQMENYCAVHPNPRALEKFKNRRVEKRFLESLKIPIAAFREVHSKKELGQALDELAAPVFLKTEEQGYDGYNQYKIDDDNRRQILSQIQFPGYWVAESFVPFEREVSFLAARAKTGEIRFYPPVENVHHQGTLLTSVAPAPRMPEALIERGRGYLCAILEATDYVGLICMECFVCGEELLVNEIAPRVHNSGHWTSKGALTSQFENHVRAVAGYPLGATETSGISGMLNLLGVTLSAEQVEDAHSFLTLYGKTLRPRRKLGHVTVNQVDEAAVRERLTVLHQLAYGPES